MTPASFAKLLLRMLSGGLLFLYVPLVLPPIIFSVIWGVKMGALPDFNAISIAMILLFAFAISLLIWIYADRLAPMLLPPGTSSVQSADYAQWQRGGMIFIGGWLALRASLYLENIIIENSFISGFLSMAFNLVAAFILIVGWGNLTRAFSRNPRKA